MDDNGGDDAGPNASERVEEHDGNLPEVEDAPSGVQSPVAVEDPDFSVAVVREEPLSPVETSSPEVHVDHENAEPGPSFEEDASIVETPVLFFPELEETSPAAGLQDVAVVGGGGDDDVEEGHVPVDAAALGTEEDDDTVHPCVPPNGLAESVPSSGERVETFDVVECSTRGGQETLTGSSVVACVTLEDAPEILSAHDEVRRACSNLQAIMGQGPADHAAKEATPVIEIGETFGECGKRE